MLTIDDVRSIPLFSALAVPELERLAQTSADLHLGAGEYAAHEGGEERALFAVLAGKMEVVKLIDGVERTLGWRVAGTIFGDKGVRNLIGDGVVQLATIRGHETAVAGRRARRAGE